MIVFTLVEVDYLSYGNCLSGNIVIWYLQAGKYMKHSAEVNEFGVNMTNTAQVSEFMHVAVNAYSMYA